MNTASRWYLQEHGPFAISGVTPKNQGTKAQTGKKRSILYLARGPGDIVEVDTADIQLLPASASSISLPATSLLAAMYWRFTAEPPRTRQLASWIHSSNGWALPFAPFRWTVAPSSWLSSRSPAENGESGSSPYPPRSPKLNGHVERAQRTHKVEFYRYADPPLSLTGINKALRTWERVHNCIRPHQALGYLTPKAFYQRHLALERS